MNPLVPGQTAPIVARVPESPAHYAAQILKGEEPGELRVQYPTNTRRWSPPDRTLYRVFAPLICGNDNELPERIDLVRPNAKTSSA